MNNEANKIPETDPKSYGPKKPEIIELAKNLSNFSETPVLKNINYLNLPDLRFIGKDVIDTEGDKNLYGEMWGKSHEFMPILDGMASCFLAISEPCALMHHNNQGADTQMHYIVGKFFQAGTPVPSGFDYYDIPHTKAALAEYYGEFNQVISCMYEQTRDRILADGYGIPYPVGYFHAEVYLKDNVPEDGVVSPMAYLFACIDK